MVLVEVALDVLDVLDVLDALDEGVAWMVERGPDVRLSR